MLNRKFHLFHLNLIPVGKDGGISREKYLRSVLEKNFEFNIGNGKREKKASWTYKGAVDESILGILQKEVPYQHHRAPDEGGAEVTTPLWQGAFVIIDPTHHKEGQRVSVEFDKVLGVPRNLLTWLFKNLNQDKNRPYEIIHELIPTENDFWNYAKKADNRLSRVQFDFVVPNMFGAEETIAEELKKIGIDTGAQKVKVTYQSSEGVDVESEQVKNAVKYIEKGQGKIKASAVGQQPFDSSKNPLTTKIPKRNADENHDIEEIKKHKDEVLGHDGKVSDTSDSNDST